MLYKNHLIVSNAIALPVMASTNTLELSSILALSFGALIPDIDEPGSYIGHRTRGISDLIKLVFGHRGITHSLLFVLLSGMLFVLVGKLLNIPLHIAFYVTLGVFLHILEDSFGNGGVEWLLPFSKKTYHIVLYNTGSLIEFLIGLLALFLIVVGFKSGNYDLAQDTFFNLSNISSFMTDFAAKVGDFIHK